MRYGWILVLAATSTIQAWDIDSSKAQWDIHSGRIVSALIRHVQQDRKNGANASEIAKNLSLSLTPVWIVAGQDHVLSGGEFQKLQGTSPRCRLDVLTRPALSALIAQKSTHGRGARMGKVRTLEANAFELGSNVVIEFAPAAQVTEELVFSKIECSGIALSDVPALLASASDSGTGLAFSPAAPKLIASLQK